jgi:hypothetical protein
VVSSQSHPFTGSTSSLTLETFKRRYVTDTITGVLPIFCQYSISSPFKRRLKLTPFPQKAGFDVINDIPISQLSLTGFLHSIHDLIVGQSGVLQAPLVVITDLVM